MNLLRNLLHDLVEKKLWPVALALVAALIAAPVVLGGGSGSTASDVAALPATAPSTLVPGGPKVVSVDATSTGEITRAGAVRDPFVQHHQPKVADLAPAPTSPSEPAPSASPSPGSSAPSGGPVSAPEPTTVTPPAAPKGTSSDAPVHGPAVTVKFGQVESTKTYKDVTKLTPLPSANEPLIVFLGLSADGKKATFLIDASATPSGDGTCKPSDDSCEQVQLQVGDIEFLDVTGDQPTSTTQYQLEVTSITKPPAATTGTAAKAHATARAAAAGGGWGMASQLGALTSGTAATRVANMPDAIAATAEGTALAAGTPTLTVPAR